MTESSRRSGKRDPYPARMQNVSMRSFASAIDEPMLFQIGDELPNLTGHIDNIIATDCPAIPKSFPQQASDNTSCAASG